MTHRHTADRTWFLTWTTYGTWLPGDERGYVSNTPTAPGHREVKHNLPGTPYTRANPFVADRAKAKLQASPVFLDPPAAKLLLGQFQETARFREWRLLAAAILRAHIHILISIPDDPHPTTIPRDLKSYGSKALNRAGYNPDRRCWWTASGSTRIVRDGRGGEMVHDYILKQNPPLLV